MHSSKWHRWDEQTAAPLTEEEATRVCDAPKGDGPRALRDRALLWFLYTTGSRVSEACRLRVADIDFQQRLVALHGRGGALRLVPLNDEGLMRLVRYFDDGRSAVCKRAAEFDEVFLTQRGPLSGDGAVQIVKRAGNLAGIDGRVLPHVLRHSLAAHALSRDVPAAAIHLMLGHTDLGTTARHTHVDFEALEREYRRCHPLA